MGRPLHKDVLGTRVTRYSGPVGSVTADAGIVVQGYFGGTLASDYQIVKQRGAKTYVVLKASVDTFTETENFASITSSNLKVGKLVSGQPAANGEIRILGSTNGQSPGTVAIAKLTKRVATDFDGNRYTWFLDNDSSADVLVLTAI